MLQNFVKEILQQARPPVAEAGGVEYINTDYIVADSTKLIAAREDFNCLKTELRAELEKVNTEIHIQRNKNMIEIESLENAITVGQKTILLENTSFEKQMQEMNNKIRETEKKQQLANLKQAKSESFNSLSAFIDFVNHEAKETLNITGKGYFILLNQAGAKFITNFDNPKDKYDYSRQLSPIFIALRRLKESRNFSQKELLEFILENKNYINNYAEAFNGFKKIKNSKTTKMDAEPILVGDETSERFEMVQSWEYNGEIKKEKVTLIPELEMSIPVILMSNTEYKINLSVTPTRGCNDTFEFDLYAPGLEYILAQALREEITFVKEQLSNLSDAYIGLDI